jgi:proton-translocating NAD(P)+ transhydrogenase subunit alpha
MATNNITTGDSDAAGREAAGAWPASAAGMAGIHTAIHSVPAAPNRFIVPAMSLDLWSMLFVFMLATFVGFQVIQNVSRLLHTPLMSLTNAISAIAVVGSLLIAGERASDLTTVLGTVAVAASMTNIVSGFLITDRMLKMFREKGSK